MKNNRGTPGPQDPEATNNNVKELAQKIKKSSFLDRLNLISKCFTIFYQTLPVIVILIILVAASLQAKKTAVLIEPFEVPTSLAELGYSGRSMSNKLLDEINSVRSRTTRSLKAIGFAPLWHVEKTELDIQIAGMSTRSFFRYLREQIGLNINRVTGEVTLQGDKISLGIRMSDQPGKTFSGELREVESLVRSAATHVLLYYDPYALAVNQFETDKNACLDTIKHILRNAPTSDDASAYDLWGRLLTHQKNYVAAHAKYELATKLDPKSAEIYSNWGSVYYQEQNYNAAHAKYERAIKLKPRLSALYFNQGAVFAAENKHNEEILAFTKAISLDPLFRDAYFQLAFASRAIGKREEEIRMLEKVIEIDPAYLPAHEELGSSLRELGKFPEALGISQKAILLNPRSGKGYYDLGLVYERIGNMKTAIHSYEQSMKHEPDGEYSRRAREHVARLRKKVP